MTSRPFAPTDEHAGLVSELRAGAPRAVALVEHCLDRIERVDGALHAFRSVFADSAREDAAAIDRRLAAGDPVGPLAGLPLAVKDNIVTALGSTTCGSRMLEGYRSPFTATAVERARAAGAVVIGSTNCDEFGMGSSTEHCAFGPTRNPWDPDRVPGGSSGGSAAAVAAGLCPLALGSDTGGSIRQPAALCGVVGLKPSYGRVSRYGLVAFGSSLDQIGPITATVEDATRVLQAIAGYDHLDATSVDRPVPDLLARLETPVDDLVVGVPAQYRGEHDHPAVRAALDDAVERLREVGVSIVDVDLPLTEYGIATYYVLAPAEASSNLARFDGIRYGHRAAGATGGLEDLYRRSRAEGLGPEVRRRIMLGTYVLSSGYYDAYYKRAMQARRLIKNEFDAAFAQCHVILGPTSPVPAFPLGAMRDPLSMYQCDVYTTNANIAGLCAISLPAGRTEPDAAAPYPLPIGIQLQAPPFEEERLLRVARMFERTTPLAGR